MINFSYTSNFVKWHVDSYVHTPDNLQSFRGIVLIDVSTVVWKRCNLWVWHEYLFSITTRLFFIGSCIGKIIDFPSWFWCKRNETFHVSSLKTYRHIHTVVVLKQMLILSRHNCNAIYRNSDKAHIFCSALLFQHALWSLVCQIDLELQLILWKQLRVPFQKKERRNEQKHKFIRSHHSTFFLKYHLFVAKHASILSTHFFFIVVSNFSFGMCGFPGSPSHLFRSSNCIVHVST